MVCMGLDIGKRRIGVAVSDTLPLDEIRAIVEARDVTLVVVGLPLRLDGSMGPEAEAATALAKQLEDDLGIEVVLEDERLTSVEAERLLVEAGVRRQARKGTTDRVAAALILQSFLDHRATRAGMGEG